MARTRGKTHQNHESLQNLAEETTVWTHDDNGKNGNDAQSAPSKPKADAKSTSIQSAASSTTRTTKRGKKTASQPNLMSDSHLTKAMEEAHYEAFVDPYRGMLPYFSVSFAGGTVGTNGPWVKCADILNEHCQSWSFSNGEEGKIEVVNVDDDEDDGKPPTKKEEVENNALVVRCGCPTVDKWANDEWEIYNKKENAKKKKGARGKKRKNSGDNDDSVKSGKNGDDAIMIVDDEKAPQNANSCGVKGSHLICGERKPDAKNMYPCDYNPFCLASLGGIVDQYRRSAAKIRNVINTQTNKPSQLELSQLIHKNMTMALNSSLQNTKHGKNDKDGDLRRSILIDIDVVQAHVSRFICESDDDTVITVCLNEIQSVHQPLVFRPHDQTPSSSQSKMELSVPSGLRNLGATCYLNSQLQCLAQNLGFVHGLFSWRRPSIDAGSDIDKRMSTVLSNMQSILARMRYGPERVICTNEFASALNLENDEMQDPNEFARLLFDRMLESFRRSTEITLGTTEQNGLGDLLPSVFGGTFVYVTQCSECSQSSMRREDFMELSVPIIDCKEESSRKKQPGKTKQANGNKSTTTGDIDVQLCVNSYLHPESLDGDNQYECSGCNKKCDATRSMVFAKLPPVLNIQLARYVFDRETLSKRKLTTKVLLPKSLEIPSSANSSQDEQVKYILCSVQNHLGNSAHGGHYVADVMDWTTGVWYEFNDEDVTILEGGPTSSFEPHETEDNVETNQPGKHRKVSGSADAYNLFYVSQSYLSMQCESELRHFDSMESEANTGTSTASGGISDILTSVKDQRKERYRLELEIQTKNMFKDRRISARQEQITKKIFLPTSKLAIPTNSDGNYTEGNNVWVDSNFLRRFFSCQDGMEDIFHSASKSSTIPRSQSLLCEHSKGLHPRVARKGKLLPSEAYNAVEDIMRKEYAMFLRDQVALHPLLIPSPELSLTDSKFVDGSNLICKDCGLSYQQEARNKFELFKTLVSIHDALIPGKSDLDPSTVLESSSIYAISRTWVTSFRKYVEKKVNELQNMPQKKSSDEANSMSYGGLDALDFSEVKVVENGKASEKNGDQSSMNPTKTPDSFKGEDPTSKISCLHECCPLMNNRRSVRFIPENVWQKITKVFPDATPHSFESPRDDAVGNCVECHIENEEENLFPQKLNDWKKEITKPGALSELLKRGKQMNNFFPSSEIEIFLQHNAEGSISLHALHHNDIQRWRDSFSAIEKSLKSRKKNDIIKNQLNELLFVSSESSSLGREWKFRKLTCNEHEMAVGLPSVSDEEDVKSWLEKLNASNVELLLGEEYRELMGSLSTLESILHGGGSAPLKESRPPTVSIQLQEGTPTIIIDPQTCTSGCDVTSFSDECIKNGTVVSKLQNPQRAKPVKDNEPIDEGPKGPLCKVFVHEVENGMDIDVSASQIMLDVSQNNTALSSSSTGRPRRSRKARGGGGGGGFPLYEVEMALDGNLAHFRLLLHQSKSKKLFGQRLFLLRISSSASEESAEELPPGSNLKTIQDIIAGSPSDSEVSNPELQKDCTIHLILSYNCVDTSKSDGTKQSTRKRLSQEEKEEEEYLLLSLSEVACGGWKTADASDTVIRGKKSKRRRQERGFQGTFLQSSELDVPDNQPLLPSTEVPEVLRPDDSENVVIDGSPKDDKDVASAKNNDDCKDLQQRVDEEVDEELSKAVQRISDCTQGLDLHSIKEKILSTINGNPDELALAVSTMVRQALMQRIQTHLQDNDEHP